MGHRLYLTTPEVQALARGEVLPLVATKAQWKLDTRPPEPIAGQTDLLTELARIEEPDGHARPTQA